MAADATVQAVREPMKAGRQKKARSLKLTFP